MTVRLNCPCGAHFVGEGEDDLVAQVREHLRTAHPGLQYTREEILFMAY